MMMTNKPPPSEYFVAEAAVWWDMDKCPIPDGYDAWKVGPCIKSELEKLGYSGPLTIFGLGDLNHMPEQVLQALFSTGIVLTQVPTRISSPSFLTLMLSWQTKHPAPVTIMIITDSRSFDFFYSPIYWLQNDRKCNVLLAYPDALKEDYSLITHKQWFWKSLLKVPIAAKQVVFLADYAALIAKALKKSPSISRMKHMHGKSLCLQFPWMN